MSYVIIKNKINFLTSPVYTLCSVYVCGSVAFVRCRVYIMYTMCLSQWLTQSFFLQHWSLHGFQMINPSRYMENMTVLTYVVKKGLSYLVLLKIYCNIRALIHINSLWLELTLLPGGWDALYIYIYIGAMATIARCFLQRLFFFLDIFSFSSNSTSSVCNVFLASAGTLTQWLTQHAVALAA